MPRQLKVFLCHAHSDKDTVKALYVRLKREGVDVWLDKEKLFPGADWEYEIRKTVRESDVVIVCLSKQFNQAGFRQKEVRIALEEADKKPEGEIFIIPARLEECDNLESLNRWHWVDLFESDGFQRLILALRIRADKIGAALRQRRATISRPKKDAEQHDAEKVRIESASREDEAQERQRIAKEQADRDADEKAERGITEIETAEKLKREQAARETAERIFRQKAKQEKNKRDEYIRIFDEEKEIRNFEQRRKRWHFQGIPGIIIAIFVVVGLFFLDYLIRNPSYSNIQVKKTATPTLAVQIGSLTPIEPPSPTNTKAVLTSDPAITSLPTLGIGSTMISEKDGMSLVYVPAGEFTMGSSDTYPDEQPIHQVDLDAFWIDQTEVTNGMYANCVQVGGCATSPSRSRSSTRYIYYGNSEFDGYPVIYVDWNQANAYCSWAGRRLPTEAEWEKAARGTDGRTYPWGEEISCTYSNYYDGFKFCVGDTALVGSYPDGASIYGALDMAGNVWEWVSSLDKVYPYDATDGREDLTASGSRVLRGGSWNRSNESVRSANRDGDGPTLANYFIGFRCALSQQ